ncbi:MULTISPECIES: RIP metalloprotease RseP [unclassified Dyella]|uniref:RIP metalloprotease RseP n=1 Tax=unclassified Dyella TaxID=2634549 RepID=UPI000C85456E|nr:MULTISPECIES: RIP metalloprotease RseP [unclassified Dyella]MDR3445627.1 RIP metalloprotease RseP [Dyella sp.]PMQ03970.1 Regulator of sigma-E protease RseP [Dyella sp. AD56]
MNSVFGSVFWLLVTLGVLVTFHEFGHYWVARRCGVKVLRFSVGFGKAIWKRIGKDGTEYQVAMIPLGGYVKMLDAREGEIDPALAGQEFTGKPVWQRIAIVAAGPGFNLVFTLFAFWLMFLVGKPDVAPVISAVPQTMAAEAGVRTGDRILSVNGHAVETWSDSMDAVANALLGRDPLPMQVRGTDGGTRNLVLPLNQLPAGQDIGQYLDKLGLKLAPSPAVIDDVLPGKPASQGGVQDGDRIVSLNGVAIGSFEEFQRLVPQEAAKSPTLAITVERAGKTIPLSVTARMESLEGQPSNWVIGVKFAEREQAILRYGPLKAMGASLETTWNSAASTFNMIGKMLTGQASTKNLSGVIGIAQVANASASMGVGWFFSFLAMVSLSLAILNLMPIPVLDGGWLLYYLIELVKGSPVSERTMMAGQYVGLVMLFTLMGLAFYNDIHRFLPA